MCQIEAGGLRITSYNVCYTKLLRESILGLERRGPCFSVDPCIPGSWDRFVVRWRHGGSLYEITVENPSRRNRGVAEAVLAGIRVDTRQIPLVDDGSYNFV